jgi:hypothetical protein
MKRFLLILAVLGIGTLATTVTSILSYFAFQTGGKLVSEILLWPNTLLQSLVLDHHSRADRGAILFLCLVGFAAVAVGRKHGFRRGLLIFIKEVLLGW